MIKNISRFRVWVRRNQKYAPVIFFMCGFLWDSLTLGRIDQLFDRIILSTYLTAASVCIYLYNLADDGKWKGTIIERVEEYLPLAIQFFFGGLFSAFVIYFSRSVSFSKTVLFFLVLLILLFANELLQKRISNKYLQFSVYFFVNFTFFTFFLPVVFSKMNSFIFLISGLVSLATTAGLIIFIYSISPSTRREIHEGKMLGVIVGIYLFINALYYFNFIPPVPLAMEKGLVAHTVTKEDGNYIVEYERSPWYNFWRSNRYEYVYNEGERVYAFTSIFAPSDLNKKVSHQWKWYSPHTEKWEVIDDIGFEITGGRDGGYRGYSYKSNMMEGKWKIDVITDEGLVLGILNFKVISDPTNQPLRLITKTF